MKFRGGSVIKIYTFFTIFLLFFTQTSFAAEKIQLRFTSVFPQTHLHTVLNQMFADEIKQKT